MNYPPHGYPPPGGYGQPPQYQYGLPPQGYPAPQGPRTVPHPYAKAAMWLGFCVMCSLVVTGVPAILLGSSALKAIKAEPQRYSGKDMALTGVVFGWIGCAITALGIGRALGAGSVGSGVVLLVVGLAIGGGVIALARKRGWGVARAVALVSTPAMLAFGASISILETRAAVADLQDKCAQNETAASVQLAARNYAAANTAIGVAQNSCPATEGAKIAELSRNISLQAAAAAQASAQATAAQKAQDLAALIASFPQKATEITASYKKAVADGNAGQWAPAQVDLSAAEADLLDFSNTSIAQDKQWQSLNAQVETLRARIQTHLEQLEKQQAAREQQQAIADDQATLNDLLAQYKDNEVRADARYKGKNVEIGGLVNTVKKDITNAIYVTIGTGEWLQIPEVQCFFDDSKAYETSRLTKGQFVRVTGTVDGLMMNVLVKNCSVVQ
jgi:hypothetical protein